MNDFFDEAMVMIAYGFRHMLMAGASEDELQSTARSMARAISQFSDECLTDIQQEKEAA